MTFTPLKTDQIDGFAARLAGFAQEAEHEQLLEFSSRLGELNTQERDRLSTELMGSFARISPTRRLHYCTSSTRKAS